MLFASTGSIAATAASLQTTNATLTSTITGCAPVITTNIPSGIDTVSVAAAAQLTAIASQFLSMAGFGAVRFTQGTTALAGTAVNYKVKEISNIVSMAISNFAIK